MSLKYIAVAAITISCIIYGITIYSQDNFFDTANRGLLTPLVEPTDAGLRFNIHDCTVYDQGTTRNNNEPTIVKGNKSFISSWIVIVRNYAAYPANNGFPPLRTEYKGLELSWGITDGTERIAVLRPLGSDFWPIGTFRAKMKGDYLTIQS